MADRPPRCHLRIEKNFEHPVEPGRPHIVIYDRVVAVAEDGTEVEISSAVTEWRELSKVGDARTLEVVLFGSHITDHDGTVTLQPEEQDAP